MSSMFKIVGFALILGISLSVLALAPPPTEVAGATGDQQDAPEIRRPVAAALSSTRFAQNEMFSPKCQTPVGLCYVAAQPLGTPCICDSGPGVIVP